MPIFRRRPSPPSGPPPDELVGRSHRLGYRLQNGRYKSAPRSDATASTLLHLEAEPTWVRLVFVNDAAQPWSVTAASIAPTSEVGDGFAAVDANGRQDPRLWQAVTFSSGDAVAAPRSAEGARSCDVPAGGGDGIALGYALSDWMPLRALPRRDDGFGWLLQVRSHARGAMRFASAVGAPDPVIGRLHRSFVASGDLTAGGSAADLARDDTCFACHGLQYVAPVAGATVVGIGDSIIHSSCTTGETSGFGLRACAMVSSAACPVSYVSEGFPGRNSLGFCTNGIWAIDHLDPQVAIVVPWTRNEPWTQAMADLAFARAVAVIEAARRKGCIPILTTAAPVCAADAATDAIRRDTNERVRAAGRNGTPVLDLDALWGRGTIPEAYRRGFDAGDHMHPNDRANAVAAEHLAAMLRRLLGL